MASVGSFEAKTHLAALLDRVGKGERITITRHGRPAAMLVPIEPAKNDHASIMEQLRALRQRVKPGGPTIREMIDAGRRY